MGLYSFLSEDPATYVVKENPELSKSKQEIEKGLKRVEQKYLATLEAVRLRWLRSFYREALEGGYGFKSLGEVVAFIVDHAEEVRKT